MNCGARLMCLLLPLVVLIDAPRPVPTPTPLEEVLDLPSEQAVERMFMAGQRDAALRALAALREAARAENDEPTWLRLLFREAVACERAGDGRSLDAAIELVAGARPPSGPRAQIGRDLMLATLERRAAATGLAAERRRRFAHADELLSRSFERRAELGDMAHGELGAVLVKQLIARPTARDELTLLVAEVLAQHAREDPIHAGSSLQFDPATLAGELAWHSDDEPIVRAAAALDDLERWHRARGRQDAALQVRIKRTRMLFETLPARGAAIIADARARMQRERASPGWSAAMADLVLLLNEIASDAREPLALAEDCARAHPTSPGGARCETIARVLRFELDDPEVGLTFAPGQDGGQLLAVRHRDRATVHLRASRLPLDDVVEDRWDRLLAASHPRAPLTGAAAPLAWTASLPSTGERRSRTTFLPTPLGSGLWRVESWLAGAPDARSPAMLALVTDLILALWTDDETIQVRAVSAKTGRPLDGVDLRLHHRQASRVASVRVAAACTGADGAAWFAYPELDGSFVVTGRLNDDVAQAIVPQRAREAEAHQPIRLLVDRERASPGQLIRWAVLVGQGARRPGTTAGRLSISAAPGVGPTSIPVVIDRYGAASGELILAPAGGASWDLKLLDPADPNRDALAVASIRAASAPPDMAIALDRPLRIAERGSTAVEGRVLGNGTRPLAGVSVSWSLITHRSPGQALERPFVASSAAIAVAAGETETGPDGRFSLRLGPAPAGVAPLTLALEARSESGGTATWSAAVNRGSPRRVSIQGPSVLLSGEPISLGIGCGDFDTREPLPGPSLLRLVRLAEPPGGNAEWTWQFPDVRPYPGADDSVPTESMLAELADGAELLRRRVIHDETGQARVELPPPAPGVYRLVAEIDGEPGTRMSRTLVVVSPEVRAPLPLALLDGTSERGPRRVYLGSAADAGPVLLQVQRPGAAPVTRWIESPVSRILEIDAPAHEGVNLRAAAVHRGVLRVLRLTLPAHPRRGLEVGIVSTDPTLDIRVGTAGDPRPLDARLTVIGRSPVEWVSGLDLRPSRWQFACPMSTSTQSLRQVVRLRPQSAADWATVRVGDHTLSRSCVVGEAERPSLPRAVLDRWWPTATSSAPDGHDPLLWATGLRPDSDGIVKLAWPSGIRSAPLRIGVAAVTSDGRVGFLETLVVPPGGAR